MNKLLFLTFSVLALGVALTLLLSQHAQARVNQYIGGCQKYLNPLTNNSYSYISAPSSRWSGKIYPRYYLINFYDIEACVSEAKGTVRADYYTKYSQTRTYAKLNGPVNDVNEYVGDIQLFIRDDTKGQTLNNSEKVSQWTGTMLQFPSFPQFYHGHPIKTQNVDFIRGHNYHSYIRVTDGNDGFILGVNSPELTAN